MKPLFSVTKILLICSPFIMACNETITISTPISQQSIETPKTSFQPIPYRPKMPETKANIEAKYFSKDISDFEGDYGSAFSCSTRAHFYDSAFKTIFPRQSLFKKIIQPTTKMVFLSENHFNGAAIREYPEIIQEIKKDFPSLDCVFLELPHDYLDTFNSYLSGKSSYHESVGHLFETEWEMFGHINQYRRDMFEVAKNLSIKIIPIDMTMEERNGKIYTDLYSKPFLKLVNKRNIEMSKRMDEAFNENGSEKSQCHLGLMPIGIRHLSAYYAITKDKNDKTAEALRPMYGKRIQELLAQKNISSVNIHILGTREGRSNSPEWIRKDCDNENPINIPYNLEGAFLVPSQNNNIPTEAAGLTSSWKDFAGAIIIPNYSWSPF